MAEDTVLPIPNLVLAQEYFVLSTSSLAHLHNDARKSLLEGIQADRTSSPSAFSVRSNLAFNTVEMAPYYRIVTSASALPLDQSLLDRMESENKDELDKIDVRLEEAKKTEGETDIADALRARANYLTRIGDKVRTRAFSPLWNATSHSPV